jgi:hypothetical protein
MGILDEAIKEHLDLKRQHGAEDSEVKRLEDEAFGPPTRPGEPDFPESQEQPVVADDGTGGVSPEGEKAEESAGEPEAATTLLEPEEAPATPAEPQPEGEPASPPEQTPAPEPAAMEHTAVDEPDAAAPEPPEGEPPTDGASEQAPPASEQPPGFFDREAADLDLDLDLDLGDEGGDDLVTDAGVVEGERSDVHEPEPEPPSEEQPVEAEAPSEEHPVEGMETVEHPMEEELGLEPPSEEQPATDEEPEPSSEEMPAEGDEEDEGTGEGDVLEETPEFLQDRPEDDELWFEQGQPKDFDF